jgi:hypothetical protein
MVNPSHCVCHCKLHGCNKTQYEAPGVGMVSGRVLSRKMFVVHQKQAKMQEQKQKPGLSVSLTELQLQVS